MWRIDNEGREVRVEVPVLAEDDGSSGGGKNGSNFRCILKMKPQDLLMDMSRLGKRVKDDVKVFVPSNW